MIVVTIILPAIQNAMFTTTTRLISQSLTVGSAQDAVDADIQTQTMTNDFQITAYSIAWLGQNQPPFTTNSYTLAPFDHSLVRSPVHTYVNVSTMRYWGEVTCWRPDAVKVNATSKRLSFADGKGCETGDVFDDAAPWNVEDSQYMAMHIPVDSPGFAFGEGTTRETNITSMCPDFPDRFLTIWWVSGSNPDFNGRGHGLALFCDTVYYKEPGMAKILLANDSVISFSASGPQKILSPREFNGTQFRHVINDGQPPNLYSQNEPHPHMILDVDKGTPVGNDRRLRNLSFATPAYTAENSYLFSWLFTLAPSPLENYLNSTILAESYDRTYRQLFALAMGRNFASDSSKTFVNVDSELQAVAVTLVPGFLYATEALLVITMLLVLWLSLHVCRTHLTLIRNPDCLAQVIDLARSPAVQAKFTPNSGSSNSILKSSLGADTFRVSMSSDGRPMLFIDSIHSIEQSPTPGNFTAHPTVVKHVPEVSWMVCSVTTLWITVITTSIYVLNWLSSRRNSGIPLPSGNAFTVQLALNFAPTLFATVLGYYINAVCRASSFLMPLQDLKKGHARATTTLLTTYTSLPPSVLSPKAFRARHYVLTMLSVLSILSNILTVSIAALFVQYDATVASTTTISDAKEPFLALMEDGDIRYMFDHQEDSIYTVTANVSGLTKLPTWTTTDYGYMPIILDETVPSARNLELEYETIGYGADLDCVDFLHINPDQMAHFELFNFGNDTSLYFEFCYGYPEDDTVACGDQDTFHWSIITYLDQVPDGEVAAYEVQATVSRPNSPSDEPFWNSQTNEQQIMLAWLRGRWKNKVTSFPSGFNSTSNINPYFEYNATVIACRPRLKTQKSLLRTDIEGNVLSELLQGTPDYDTEDRLNLTNTLRATIQAVAGKEPSQMVGWHTNIIAQDWPNYVYKTILNTTDMVDPVKPVPSVDFASAAASQAFSRLFAAQLSLDRQYLQPTGASSNASRSATLYHSARHFRLSHPMFIITQTILILDVVGLLLFRIRLPKPFLPRQPFTIASQIAYAAASHVIDDIAAAVDRAGNYKASSDLQRQFQEYRFGYGKYIGKDGRPHIGIERDPFVQKFK